MALSAREYHLLRKFGITQEQYDELLDRQGGGCGVCSKTPKEEGQSLAVDHDHKTGEIRGILCRYCNHRLIGRHRSGDLLRRMTSYLDQQTGWFVPPKPKRRRKTTRKGKNGKTTRSKNSSS